MTREEAKEILPIIKAYSEGKTIQLQKEDCSWIVLNKPNFTSAPIRYRIKPESKYRPFKDAEECWNEMQKHQPFGWLISKRKSYIFLIQSISIDDSTFEINDHWYTTEEASKYYTFADGTPFGIKEE